jgi:hypothetical protein
MQPPSQWIARSASHAYHWPVIATVCFSRVRHLDDAVSYARELQSDAYPLVRFGIHR